MNKRLAAILLLAGTLVVRSAPIAPPPAEPQLQAQVREIVSRMTPEEKVAQLSGTRWSGWFNGAQLNPRRLDCLSNGMGHIAQFALTSDLTPDQMAAAIRQVQDYLRKKTRLGIPAIFHDEATCGLNMRGATLFPQQIGMGCTWNPQQVMANTTAIRQLMLKIGARQALAPNLDINRNAHWERIEEAYGEDPYLTSLYGLAYIRAMQTDDLRQGVAVTLKHFAGYGDGGAAANVDPWTFREESLRPYEVAIRLGHAQSAMAGYHALNGEPVAGSKELLTNILRGNLGFDGVVVSDYGAVSFIANRYHRANGLKEAAVAAVTAGDDVDLPDGTSFAFLPEAVKEGLVSQAAIDQAVERQLMVKARLGLLDNPPASEGDPQPILADGPAERKLAYDSACQSLVLLKNEGVLPIRSGVHSIAVIGPNAASLESLCGDYSHQSLANIYGGHAIHPDDPKLVTLLDGLKAKAGPGIKVSYEQGCSWTGLLDENYETVPASVVRPAMDATESGWLGTYFKGQNLTGVPVITRTDPAIAFDWNENGPSQELGHDDYSVRWTGFITPETSGPYTFVLNADDGARLLLNGHKVIDDWSIHGARDTASQPIVLDAGKSYPVTVEYFQATMNASVNLKWQRPNVEAPFVKTAAQSDLIIAAVGENYQISGEAHPRSDARLPGNQEELVRELAATGKPVVLVYMGGRPPILTNVEPLCQAMVCAWYPGEEGGNAIADLLLGNINPSGKLSTTLPRRDEQCPIAYEWGYKSNDMPLYPFGYGLSYTTYSYGGLTAPARALTSEAWIPIRFTLKNTGQRDGIEIAQLYVTPENIKAPHPVEVLRGFARVALKAGETKTVTISVSPQTLAFYDKQMRLVIEPGQYEFRIGASSTDTRLKTTVALTGEPVKLAKREVFFHQVDTMKPANHL